MIDKRLKLFALTVAVACNITAAHAAEVGNYKSLEDEVLQARKRLNPPRESDALYELGKAHFNNGDLKEAEALMREALAIESKLSRPKASVETRIALGAILWQLRRYDESSVFYNEALAQAQHFDLSEQILLIYNNMAIRALNANKLDDAQKLFQQAYDKASATANSDQQAAALVNLSVVFQKQNDSARGLEFAEKASKIAEESADPRSIAAAALQVGRCMENSGSLERALASYEKAANAFDEAGEDQQKVSALSSIAKIYLGLRKPTQAKEALAKTATANLGDSPSELRLKTLVLIQIGSAQADLGDYSAAEKAHADALVLATASGAVDNEIDALSGQGLDYYLQGNCEKALAKFTDAESKLPVKANPADKAALLRNIGMCYRSLGQIPAAIKYYSVAGAYFAQAHDTVNEAMAIESIAVAQLDTLDGEMFEKNHARASSLLASSKNPSANATLAYNYAQYKLYGGHYAEALTFYQQAQDLFHQGHDQIGETHVLKGLGLCYLQLDKIAEAQSAYENAVAVAGDTASLETKWDCSLGLGKVYRKTGNDAKAESYLRKAVALVETERTQLSKDTFKTSDLDLRQDCFLELIDLLIKQNKFDEALEIAEKGRSRAFLDLLEGKRKGRLLNAPTNLSTSIDDRSLVSAPKLAPAATAGTRSVEVVPKPHALVEISAISPVNAAPPSLTEIHDLVKKSDSLVIEYLMMKDKILIWIVKPTGEIIMPPPVVISAVQLEHKIDQTYNSIVMQPHSMKELEEADRKRQQNLQDLYKLIIGPVEKFLPPSDTAITIVPYGPLFSVPFAALISPNNKFFAEEHTIAYIPAIGVLRATEKIEEGMAGQPNSLLAMGNPITKAISFLGALPYAEKEVKGVAALFGASHATVEVGQEATKRSFVNLAPKNSIIHLATHGLIDQEHPMDSALVLAPEAADDGLLTVRDILNLPALKAKLTVLSACQTGRGKITGDGVVGLSRAFIIAGTPSIMVSLWNVDDVMTEYQMVSMYEEFLKGDSKAKALRKAQMKTIQFMEKGTAFTSTAGVRANPRYWAAFQLIGDHR